MLPIYTHRRFRKISLLTLLVISGFSYGQTRKVINTERKNPVGILTFPSTFKVIANYVDGYVKVSGDARFIFPVGDNGVYRPFAVNGNASDGAYFKADPSTAITSNPLGGNYGVLPAGGPFPVTSRNTHVTKVSDKEYWDINGTIATKITLTWDEASGIAALLNGASLSKLYIVGWNGSKWTKITSYLDGTSILGGASTVSKGSITTATIVPNAYSVYTFGADPATAPPAATARLSGTSDDQTIYLNWDHTDTSSQEYIEKYIDNRWTILSFPEVEPIGIDGQVNVQDSEPVQGRNQYRLRVVNADKSASVHPFSINFYKREFDIEFFPNPASDRIYIKSSNFDLVKQILVFDTSGRLRTSLSSYTSDGIDVREFEPGSYIIRIEEIDGRITSKKVIVE